MILTLHNPEPMKKIKSYIKGSIVLMLMTATSLSTFAQDATADKQTDIVRIPKMFFDPVTYIWILLGFILLVTIYTLSRTVNQLTNVIEKQNGRANAQPGAAGSTYVEKPKTAWSQLMKLLTRSVPIEKEADVMLDHDYDGIKELDNALPPWWKWGFYFTILFAFVYLTYYHVSGSGPLQAEEYQAQMDLAAAEKKAMMEKNANIVTVDNVVVLSDAESIAAGKNTFMTYCKACHGDFGQGNVGPNLTDEFWIHGGGIKNVFNTVTEGVPAKGMISWKSQLAPKVIQQVSSYILTLKGTNPAGAKEPQGEKWVEQGAVAADSTAAAPDSAAVAKK
jgi:cytochrome c oxidase cbb3-type subunit 3